jgi:hypothetical protein
MPEGLVDLEEAGSSVGGAGAGFTKFSFVLANALDLGLQYESCEEPCFVSTCVMSTSKVRN